MKDKFIVLTGDEISTNRINQLYSEGYEILSHEGNKLILIYQQDNKGVYKALQEDAINSTRPSPSRDSFDKAERVGLDRLSKAKYGKKASKK